MRILVALLLPLLPLPALAADGQGTPAQLEFFEKKVRPLLTRHCYGCHSRKARKLQAGFKLDSRAGVLKGGDSGAAVVPGKPDNSLLIRSVRYLAYEMPPSGKLKPAEIDVLVEWVRIGVPWPREQPTTTPAKPGGAYDYAAIRKSHWAYRPLGKPALPGVKDEAWVANEIDRFVLARLETAGLAPAPEAERRTLLRRVKFDLLGLPPTPEETRTFVADTRPDAWPRLIDRLLASSHYGERWGRHWLDVARYSDGFGGFLDNAALPHAWRYRDWVVEAFNRDLPFDQFVRQQVAGDLLPENPEAAGGTGFFAIGPTYKSDGGDPDSVAQARSETLDDRVDSLTRGFLGLTVSCARCHAHKFDPIPQEDYYSLAGIFNNTRKVDRKLMPEQRVIHALADTGGKDMAVALRGNPRKPGKVVPRRFLRILAGENRKPFTRGSGRLGLADALVDPSNPLTAKVFVNRAWKWHVGRGLVRSPSNFGVLGEKPTHPGLLEWLAADFVEHGWSIKRLHRTILHSATFRQGSVFNKRAFDLDGDNRLIWRSNPRRLDVEAWRDALLAVTGELDVTFGGPPTEDVRGSRRRTMYFKISRTGDRFATDQFLRLFDFPIPRATIAKRPRSTVPQQFLFLLNSPIMIDRARALVARLEQEQLDDRDRIERAYRLLFGRPPTPLEEQLARDFLDAKPAERSSGDTRDRPDILVGSFEDGSYGRWKATGDAFGPKPPSGTLPNQMNVSGFLGNGLVNTYFRGDRTTGTLTSPEFTIQRKRIAFLIGGGRHPGKTCIELHVDGRVVRTATGQNNELLQWRGWDVAEFGERTARIRIVDQVTGGWGHINIDHIGQTDQRQVGTPPPPALDPWTQYVQVLLGSNEFMFVR